MALVEERTCSVLNSVIIHWVKNDWILESCRDIKIGNTNNNSASNNGEEKYPVEFAIWIRNTK